MQLNPGTRLGPYEILAPLGAGGMGEVHRARDTRLLVVGSHGERERCLLTTDLDGHAAELVIAEELSPDFVLGVPQSADGEQVVLRRPDGQHLLASMSTREVRPLPGLVPGDLVLRFLAGDRRADALAHAHAAGPGGNHLHRRPRLRS